MSFVVGIQIARSLGPTGFGVYGTVMAITALLVVPSQFGLPQLLTRELAGELAASNFGRAKRAIVDFTKTVCSVSLAVSLSGLIVANLLVPQSNPVLLHALWWGIGAIPALALLNLLIGALRGMHQVVTAQLYDTLARPSLLCIFLAMMTLLAPLQASSAMALQATTAFIALAACAVQAMKSCPREVVAAATTPRPKGWHVSSMSMMSTEILRVADGQYGVLLLSLIATDHDAGIFRAALSIGAFVGLPISLLNVALMPFLARLHADRDRGRLQILASGSALFSFVAIASITLGLLLFGPRLIQFALGSAFVSAWTPLMLISVAYMINAFFGSASAMLNMCGGERTLTAVYAVGPLVGVAVGLSLYQSFGLLSVPFGMIIAELIKGGWMSYAVGRKLGIAVSVYSATALIPRRTAPLPRP